MQEPGPLAAAYERKRRSACTRSISTCFKGLPRQKLTPHELSFPCGKQWIEAEIERVGCRFQEVFYFEALLAVRNYLPRQNRLEHQGD